MSLEAVVLGIAQDGGVPHAGCQCVNCRRAWSDPASRQLVACLGVVDHDNQQSWLIDATPDFPEQLWALQSLAPACRLAGIALTHAHIGHYAGLIHLGREVMNTHGVPLYVSPRLAAFLRHNAPWSQLVARHNVELHQLTVGMPTRLSPQLQLLPLPVPHRDELSDTIAFVVGGPNRLLFYCPDIDAWHMWDRDLRTALDGVAIALLDATFFSASELPGRDLSQVPHPLVTDTVLRLADVACDVYLIHLNHTNPLLGPGPEREWLAAQGFKVAAGGQRWTL